MEPLRIHLFGGFLLERGGTALPPIASRAGRSLFAYLVMQRGRPLQRDLIAGSFWPEFPEGKARRRLSHTLWQIQDVITEGDTSPLAVTLDTLTFDTSTPYWLDVEEFDRIFDSLGLPGRTAQLGRAEDAAALRTCVELYRGDFLAGFFDDWVAVEQDIYRERHMAALSRLVEATKGQGAYEEALAYARRITHHDPLREEAHQEVMRLCFLLGRTNDAVQQFERCRSVLADELGAEPSQPTVELYRRIVQQRRASVPSAEAKPAMLLDSGSEVPFVGRDQERRSLVDQLERVLAGRGGVVLVEGEPGVGKTRLALEAADDARWRGFEVSWGAAREGTRRPFAPLSEVLESLSPLRAEQLSEQMSPVWLAEALRLAPRLAERVSVDPASAPLRPAEESSRMQEALVATFGALGRIAPHLVVVDDVHWADRDTLGVLSRLGPRLAGSRVLLLLLYRSEEGRGEPEVWDVLRDLDRVAGLGRVVLSPLSVFELGDMVQRLLGIGRVEPAVAARLHRRTGGNVLFTLETLLALRDQGLLEGGADPARALERQLAGDSLPVAHRVRSVIDARTSLLGEHAATVVEAAAVCGDAADLAVLGAGAGLSRAALLDAVDDLLHRRLVESLPNGRYRIAHDQIRQVVYEGLDAARRVEMHRRVADSLLEVAPDDIDALGYHFGAAGMPDRAAGFLLQAGLRAERLHAFETAAEHLEAARTAAEEGEWAPEDRYEVLGALERVLGILGRRSRQAGVVDEMASIGAQATPGDIDRRRAWLLAHTGRFTEAEECALHSVDVSRRAGDRAALAASLVALGTLLRWAGRPLDALPCLRQAIEAADGDDRRLADSHTELGSTLVEVQRFPEAFQHLAEAGRLFRDLGDLRGEAEVAGIEARALRQIGNTDRAAVMYDRALELCRRIGYRHGEGVNLVNGANLHYLIGRPTEALSRYDEASVVFGEIGNQRGEAMVLANAASVRHSLLGDDDRAAIDAERAMRHFRDIGDRVGEAQCLEVLAGVARRRGDDGEALRRLELSLEALAGAGNRSLEAQHLRSLALLHLAAGRHPEALAVLDRAARVCAEAGLSDLPVEILSIRAVGLLATGSPGEALSAAREAVDRLGPGVEGAHLVHHRHAVVAGAAGRRDEARRAAGEAHRLLLEALEGLGDAEREAALERVAEHREIVDAWASLSPRAVEVRLAAQDAPIGRALGESDRRTVWWTVDHPDDESVADRLERRRRRLLRLLAEAAGAGATPSMEDLALALDVSPSTVGRDLAALRTDGHHIVTRGDASRAS